MRVSRFVAAAASMATILFSGTGGAQSVRPQLADSFRLGQGGGVLCQVQTRGRDPAIAGMFDRAWVIVCRDSAQPVGRIFALRGDATQAAARLAQIRSDQVNCTSQGSEPLDDLGSAATQDCTLRDGAVSYKVMSVRKDNVLWVAEGLAAYDSALKLGLRSVIADRVVAGKIDVATSATDDPAAFARAQAATLDPEIALAEGYRRNNSGNYAEAAEFFDTLQQRVRGSRSVEERQREYLINRALQKSNLGDFAEAEALFDQARRLPVVDRIQTRLQRNFEAIHLLNQQRYGDALSRLDQPVAPLERSSQMPGSAIEIGTQVAAEINAGLPIGQRLGATESSALSPLERGILLDAQAMQLRGTLFRLQGKPRDAIPLFNQANDEVLSVRNGRVVSVIRLRSQVLAEAGLALEDADDLSGAESKLRESVTLLETRYPQSVAVNSARARLGAFFVRHNKDAEAAAEYKTVIASLATSQSYTSGIGNLLSPYFELLVKTSATNPSAAADMFVAGQLLVRPGIADTNAILARELSEGSSEGSRLFRQSRTLERDIERSRIELATLTLAPDQTADVVQAITTLRGNIDTLAAEQTATQARLAEFPQFRAIAPRVIGLDDMKAALKPGEAYFKVIVSGRSVFGLWVDDTGSTGYRTSLSAEDLERTVDQLRETIAADEGGQVTTYAFDVPLSRKLYEALLGPVSERARAAKHIVFEPDGGMLRLPLNLLIASQPGADAYARRIALPNADEFDLRGIDWLGRGRAISTTVSARAFHDARKLPVSNAQRRYLGFGENAPITGAVTRAATRSLGAGNADCTWPTSEWSKPIPASELRDAQRLIGDASSAVVTGAAFSDSAVKARTDLSQYRILHFATHGLVTAPRPDCPARPALLTSFGGSESDGLLSFSEIFDLKINADLVILSACDTAGKATVTATREAGLTSGGGNALDGLVRAFIGAGARSVLASHWPAPDSFNATQRLITGLFQAPSGTTVGDAMAHAQMKLMDDPETSHPYYWSGFAIIGDGGRPLLDNR